MNKTFLAGFFSSLIGFFLALIGWPFFSSTLLIAVGLTLFVGGLALMEAPDARSRSRR